MKTQITASPELFGAMVSHLADNDFDAFRNNPTDFLRNNLDVDSDIHIKTANNAVGVVHLVLPYYSSLDSMQRAVMMSDEELENATGGMGSAGINVGNQLASDFLNNSDSGAAQTTQRVYRRLSDDHYGSAKSSFTASPVAQAGNTGATTANK